MVLCTQFLYLPFDDPARLLGGVAQNSTKTRESDYLARRSAG
jgi:hypothetical protein